MPTVSTHAANADAHQVDIYRRMTPKQRMEQAMQMNRQMRELMDSGLRATHPQLSADGRRREIARRTLLARSWLHRAFHAPAGIRRTGLHGDRCHRRQSAALHGLGVPAREQPYFPGGWAAAAVGLGSKPGL
jgi:hypothetical protein